MAYVYMQLLLILVQFNNSDRFQILHALTLATRSYALLGQEVNNLPCTE